MLNLMRLPWNEHEFFCVQFDFLKSFFVLVSVIVPKLDQSQTYIRVTLELDFFVLVLVFVSFADVALARQRKHAFSALALRNVLV